MNELKKYSQRLNLVIAVLGTAVGLLPFWETSLGTHYALVFTLFSVASAFCVAKRQNLN